MKVVALVSGGKDSCYAMMECVRYGHEIVCLAHLHPPSHLTADEQEIDSFMYQSVGHNVVQLIAQSMERPLVTETITGKAIKTEIDYMTTTEGDEVEDLYRLLVKVQASFPDVQAVCSGAIFSSYQRNRVENVCSRLGLTSLGFLWRCNQEELLNDMVDAGVEAILVKVAAIGLHPRKHLGHTIADMQMELLTLQEKYELNVCGEGGEYETLTLDCPLFKKRIVIDSSRIVIHSDDFFAPVGFLVVEQCHLEDKPEQQDPTEILVNPLRSPYVPPEQQTTSSQQQYTSASPTTAIAYATDQAALSPPDKSCSLFRDQCFVGGIMSAKSDLLSLPEEIKDVFDQTTAILAENDMSMDDVCFVHLYVREMADFALINAEYCKYIGQQKPPSRSCVELRSLRSRVLLDCFALKGSGTAKMETQPRSAMRDVLHVKSVSAWAPNCIGPYSQANILHKSLILLAGQVAFQPQTMEIVGDDHMEQLDQSLRNAGNVLDALQSNLRHVCSAVVYTTAATGASRSRATDLVATESRRLLMENASLKDAFEDAYNSDESDDDVDKHEQLVSLVEHAPLLVVQLSHLPRHALVEVELQALTHAPVKFLAPRSCKMDPVDLGYGWQVDTQVSLIPRTLCHVVCTATASENNKFLPSACRGLLLAVESAFEEAELAWDLLCHLRIFYVPNEATKSEQEIATAIYEVLADGIHKGVVSPPALTFVPVEEIQNGAHVAIQVTAQDLDRLETDLWLRKQV